MSAGPVSGDVAVVIPARNEADRVQATATAARSAGAVVTRHARNRGKGAALETGAEAARLLDQREQRDRPRHLLFLDADLAATAALAGPLTEPILAGRADVTMAVVADTGKLGGRGAGGGLFVAR